MLNDLDISLYSCVKKCSSAPWIECYISGGSGGTTLKRTRQIRSSW